MALRPHPGTRDDEQSVERAQAVPAWYAVEVKRYCESRVVRHLALRAVPSFLPFIEVTRRNGGRRLSRLEPLFPGYLFVHVPPLRSDPRVWHIVRWSPGVRSILGSGGIPVPVPEEVIGAIQERVGELGYIKPGLRFSPGARVRILNGPLQGLEAIFDRPMSRAGRVRILLELLGQQRAVEVDALDLELA
ncbi:MAG: transcription termination/antitermination NusG family protein [Armatimonadota bacterium]|nr:transcription termination/antitermination NusG family protein [Armatimonadota bacterium]